MSSGRVCARCSRIKQRCDGGSPCSRCARLGHICETQLPDKEGSVAPVAYRRPRTSRSRGGCLPCKARKKKCDEIKPRCSDCHRLNLPCRWKPTTSNQPDLDPTLTPTPTAVTPAVVERGSLVSHSSSPSDSAPMQSDALSVAQSPGPTASDSSVSVSVPSPFNDDPMLLVKALFTPPLTSPVASPSLTPNPHLHSDEDRSLFNHYVHIVARALSRSSHHNGNPFLKTLLPMAAASDTVTNVILGLSGCHWKRVYPGIWNCALIRQGRALVQVSTLLSLSDRRSTLEACTTVLLLCLTELFEGTSRVWKWHLKAASAILKFPGLQDPSSSEWDFCISLFHYLDSMSTISRCKPPLLHNGKADLTTILTQNKTTTITTPTPLLSSRLSMNAIYGISPALLDFLGMVNLLANHRSRRVDELSEIGFRTAAAHVQRQVDAWRVQHDELGFVGDTDTEHATTAFEWAIRLRLHQIVDGYDPVHVYVERAITAILDAALEIPYGSPLEGCLLFPLVIAGASSMGIERRMMVKERLMVMENTLGFGHVQHARQLLETVWEEGEMELNWARVRYSKFPGMVFV